MKTIVIAAGYATRLGELTRNFPKPLLKIGSTTILDRMLSDIDTIADIDEHIIVSNHKFAPIFEQWAADAKDNYRKPVTIIDDGTETNDTRLGAVCDLLLAINGIYDLPISDLRFDSDDAQETVNRKSADAQQIVNRKSANRKLDDDLLVVAADNLLHFRFQEFVDFFKTKHTSCIMCHEQPDVERLRRTGVIEVDADWRVLSMEEKPQEPKTHWAVPPFYIYARKDLDLIRHSVENGCGKDAPGNLAHYMVEHTTMHAWPMTAGRFDIGSLDTYYEAQRLFG